ncbi:MAG: aminodeoxychorismate/anthranilate synthase component II [Colwellia sp.]|nr:aminodeoxychorismate/anthranilate synthase component II [Colwellia sp.]
MHDQSANHKGNNDNENVKIFMLDNLDSFTYNLVDEFQCLGFEPTIYRNTLSADFIFEQMQNCTDRVLLILSPGPGEPSKAGCLMALIAKCAGKYPILGICLGHQALVEHYGGIIERAPEIVHGKASSITHRQKGVFENINHPLPVARYHSLVASKVPKTLDIIAEYVTSEQISLPMAIEHKSDLALGFQFHPESILTTYGGTLLAQTISYLLTESLSATDKVNTAGASHE